MLNSHTNKPDKARKQTSTCGSDCGSCHTFPAPFRRIGESSFCRFTTHKLREDERMPFPGDRMVRILFVMKGRVNIQDSAKRVCEFDEGSYVCLGRGETYDATALVASQVVLLSLLHRIEFCEQDIYAREMPHDSVVKMDSMPALPIAPAIKVLIKSLFDIQPLVECARFHHHKVTELFMMIKVLYTPTEHAYFFQSMIQSEDNFRVFVCNNYDKAATVAELADLAGMSMSVFKRRFAEHFNDSIYHWMMRQKALKVFADIREGETSNKVLMAKYGFKYYTQFSRFCKIYLQTTPAQLISSVKEG